MSDEIVLQKSANFLFRDAELNPILRWILNYQTFGLNSSTLQGIRRYYGGLWVGGVLTATRKRLAFKPNVLNRMSYESTMEVDISFGAIIEIKDRPGIITGMVDFILADKTLTFRCFGAKALATSLRKMIESI